MQFQDFNGFHVAQSHDRVTRRARPVQKNRLRGVGCVGDVGCVGPVSDVGDVGDVGCGFSFILLAVGQPWTALENAMAPSRSSEHLTRSRLPSHPSPKPSARASGNLVTW